MVYLNKNDFISSKNRIEEILNSKKDTEIKEIIPNSNSSEFTYDNGFYTDVTAIFIDIRNSTKLFSDPNNRKTTIAKIIRCFSSEIIDLLIKCKNYKEIGIRGDCVYAIYNIKTDEDKLNILNLAFYINTYMEMLNKLLIKNSLSPINVGIGIDSSKVLVVKAGRKESGINNLVWIGKAVSKASKLSGLGNKEIQFSDNKRKLQPILMTQNFYESIIQIYRQTRDKPNYFNFDRVYLPIEKNNAKELIYECNYVKDDFNKWIEGGMKNE